MQSKSTKTFQVPQPIDEVWRFLSDPRKVAPCLPGAQITEAVDDRTFRGTITVKIGPVSTSFKGQVKVERLDEQNHEMELVGAGQDPRGGGGASMKLIGKLNALPSGGTEVIGTTEVSATGRVAQFGARMMDDVANHMFAQFTKAFQERLAAETNQTTEAQRHGEVKNSANPESQFIKAIPLFFAVIKNAIVRLLGRGGS